MVGVGTFVESKYGPKDTSGPGGVSSLFGVTPAILSAFGFWVTVYGVSVVGKARSKYKELAIEDGEENAEDRYSYPNLYVEGNSKHAKAFNCVQRSHQHMFENLTQVVLSAMTGAVSYPITTALATLVFVVGRYKFTMGYAHSEGEASKRYSSSLAIYMWYGQVMTTGLAILSCVNIVAGKKIW